MGKEALKYSMQTFENCKKRKKQFLWIWWNKTKVDINGMLAPQNLQIFCSILKKIEINMLQSKNICTSCLYCNIFVTLFQWNDGNASDLYIFFYRLVLIFSKTDQ